MGAPRTYQERGPLWRWYPPPPHNRPGGAALLSEVGHPCADHTVTLDHRPQHQCGRGHLGAATGGPNVALLAPLLFPPLVPYRDQCQLSPTTLSSWYGRSSRSSSQCYRIPHQFNGIPKELKMNLPKRISFDFVKLNANGQSRRNVICINSHYGLNPHSASPLSLFHIDLC